MYVFHCDLSFAALCTPPHHPLTTSYQWTVKGVSRKHVRESVGANWPLKTHGGKEGGGESAGEKDGVEEIDCAPEGCLFELTSDPGERTNLGE
jgi:hypothetical protein